MSSEMDHNNQLANNFQINPTGSHMEFSLPKADSPDGVSYTSLINIFESVLKQQPLGSVNIYLQYPSVHVNEDGEKSIVNRRIIYDNKKPVLPKIKNPTPDDITIHLDALANAIATESQGASKIEITKDIDAQKKYQEHVASVDLSVSEFIENLPGLESL